MVAEEAVDRAAPIDGGAARADDAPETFRDFGLSEPVLRALEELGYEAPTPVQSATIHLLMAGRDVIAQAQTGTGKTAAYGIPMVERIDAARRAPQGLVLAPTRELAVQVAEALHQIGKYRGLRVLPIYGGQPYERQLRALRDGVHVVVGTPGRVLDHLRRGTLLLGEVHFTVLDEADEMLDMGFLEDVEAILAALPAPGADEEARPDADAGAAVAASAIATPAVSGYVQKGLFSATIPAPVERLARRFLRDAARIAITPEQVTVPQITQVAYEIAGVEKLDALARVLDVETPGSAIVFCATRRAVDDVADRLAVRGYRAAALHGDMAQSERERVLRRFREGQIEVLVATDVAARGLDIEAVTHVINFDVPWDPELYIHRIGRTGRAGRAGDAITLVTPRDYRLLRTIEQLLRKRITRKRLPTLADVAARRREAAKAAVAGTIAGGGLDEYLTLAGELGDEYDPIEVAAAALRLWDEARSAGAASEGMSLAGVLKAAQAEAARAREVGARRADELQAREAAAEFEADGQAPEAGMARLFIAAGRVDGLRPQDLVGAIAGEAGIAGRAIGAIDIYDRFSFVELPQEHAQRVIKALAHATIRGRRVSARLARPEGAVPPRRVKGRPAQTGTKPARRTVAVRTRRSAAAARPPRARSRK
jgi:ATP-dependent RNA helicase DeaD